MSEKGSESTIGKETTMSDKRSESAWVEEVKYRYTEGAWSRKKMRESFGTVSIYRIPKFLKDLNARAYIPRVVSLGFFNHQPTKELSEIDRRKVDAVLKMWQRLPPQKQNSLFDVFKESISRIKSCYEDETDAEDETVIWTCLLDGCFVLEILRVLTRPEEKKKQLDISPSASDVEGGSDPMYNKNRIKSCQFDILGDFFMMENQIPIVALVKLLQLEMDSPLIAAKELYKMLCDIALILHPFLPRGFPDEEKPDWIEEDADLEKYKHMLGLFHSFVTEEYLARRHKDKTQQDVQKDSCAICIPIKNCVGSHQERQQLQTQSDKNQNEIEKKPDEDRFLKAFIKCSASELFDSGMKFQPYYGVPSKEKLSFDRNKRALLLPKVFITDSSEMIFRNLMAMEVCQPESVKHISYYVLLMNTLIEGEKDAAVLRRTGIIQSSMGTDDEVTDLFNGLCKGLNLQDIDEDPFVKVKLDLNDWYNNRSMVKFKKCLQKHPRLVKNVSMFWAILLVVAAALPTLYPIFQKYIKGQHNS